MSESRGSPIAPCAACGCADAGGAAVHEVAAALMQDDLDRAIEAGLLAATPCPACAPACSERLAAARDTRLAALAARERYRARQARLQRRAEERAAARAVAFAPEATTETKPALPSAAAAALARAKARAAERHKP